MLHWDYSAAIQELFSFLGKRTKQLGFDVRIWKGGMAWRSGHHTIVILVKTEILESGETSGAGLKLTYSQSQ